MAEPAKPETDLPLLGIDFVFEMGLKKIEEQLKEIEALDVKLGILFGFLGTVLVALIAVILTAAPGTIESAVGWPVQMLLFFGIVMTGLALINTFLAFRIRQYFGTPRYSDIVRWLHEEPKRAKFVFVDTLLEAVEGNSQRLEDKQIYTNRSIWRVFLGFLCFLFGIMIFSIRLLFRG